MKIYPIITLFFSFLFACNERMLEATESLGTPETYITVLGIAQDAGYPQAGCQKSCCRDLWESPTARKMVSSLVVSQVNIVG